MSSGKFAVSSIAIIVALVLVCHMTSATVSVPVSAVNATNNGTVVKKSAVSDGLPAFASNANVAHLRVSRKGGIGGAIAGGVASGAAMTAIGGLLGGRI